MHKINIDKNIIYTYGALMTGVLVGCGIFLFSILYNENLLVNLGLEEYDITVVMNVPQEKIFFLILKKRLLQMILFVLVMVLLSYNWATLLFCGGGGLYYGIVICNLIVKYGMNGLGYGLGCFFPHYALYFMVIYMCGKWFSAKDKYSQKYYETVNLLRYIVSTCVIIMLIFAALIWEIKFQKNFLNYFFQYLV